MTRLLSVLAVYITISTTCFAASFGDFKNPLSKKDAAPPIDTGSLIDQQAGIVETLVAGLTEYSSGQIIVAKALGLKEEADMLGSEQEALGSGNVNDKGSIERSMTVTSSAQEAIDKKIEEGAVLNEEAKQELAKALPFYARGTVYTSKLVPETKDWGIAALGSIKSAGMIEAGKLKKQLDTGMFIASKLPGYFKSAKDSYASLIAFSKKNEIDTSEADSMLDFDI